MTRYGDAFTAQLSILASLLVAKNSPRNETRKRSRRGLVKKPTRYRFLFGEGAVNFERGIQARGHRAPPYREIKATFHHRMKRLEQEHEAALGRPGAGDPSLMVDAMADTMRKMISVSVRLRFLARSLRASPIKSLPRNFL